MAGGSKRVIKTLTEHLNKSPILFNASTTIGNATERAQKTMLVLQNKASEKYKSIVKQVNDSTIIQNFHDAALEPVSPLPKRLVNYWQWYQQITGLDKVEIARQHVIKVQDKLFKSQEERRALTQRTSLVNEKLKEIYSELIQTKRDDPKYVQLTILENKGLQEQTRITDQLNLLEEQERDNFTELATAIKEYHDSQIMSSQTYKYLSIVASAILAIFSLIASMIYNNRRMRSIERNLNEKCSAILTRIDTQEKSIHSALGVTKVNVTDDYQILVPEVERLRQYSYYLGLTVCTLYILQFIFRS